jgi:hypothetical protein
MNQSTGRRPSLLSATGDYYLIVLAVLLAGYALLGKVFAYVGVAPLYVGEMTFALGVLAFLHSRCALATLATMPILLLVLLASWTLLRTLPYVGEYGLDALRDSVIVVYGGFAFITTALLLEKPERLPLVICYLRVLGTVLVPLAPILVLMSDESYFSATGDFALAYVKVGTTSVHLAAAALLVLLGFRRLNVIWLGLLFVGMAAAASQNRGGMLAMITMLSVAMIAAGRLREYGGFLVVAAGLIAVGYVLDLSIPTQRARDISAVQLVNNFASIFGASAENLDTTKLWRLQWWDSIIDYTFNGPYFWAGKGFGVNLAFADGIVSGGVSPLVPVLRSPHSGHLTILARTGVPGLTLWLLTLGSWSIMLIVNMLHARRRGDDAWANFFLLVFCYGLGFMIDAMFDVTLEGPMAGIWFWSLFGVGTGATMIYRAEFRPAVLQHSRPASPQVMQNM